MAWERFYGCAPSLRRRSPPASSERLGDVLAERPDLGRLATLRRAHQMNGDPRRLPIGQQMLHRSTGELLLAALEAAAAGVRVNAVAPGPVETPMLERFVGRNEDAKARFRAAIPAKRASTPGEIAATIAFLASEKARYLTGQSIAVD